MTSMMNSMVGFKHAWEFYTNNIGTSHDLTPQQISEIAQESRFCEKLFC
jgi:hypothetical protein